MKAAIRWVVMLALVLAGYDTASAQVQTQEGVRLRVYLDCSACDSDYIRTEIGWIDYVRDRQDSDIHILVTTQTTGAGGREYTFNFIGRNEFAAKSDTIRYVASLDDTNDVRRQGTVQTLKIGLMRYVAELPLASRIRISVAPLGGPAAGPQVPTADPWNAWVFSIGSSGFLNGESRQQFSSASVSLSANRTTDQWKVRLTGRSSYSESNFDVDSVTSIKSLRRSYTGSLLVVKSLGPRLSAGLEGEVESSTFGNIEVAVRMAPAIEFDVFPYSESTRRIFVIQYSIGVNSFDYRERTIFDETAETRPAHALSVNYTTRQPWGSNSIGLSGSQFLHDTSKYSWSASGSASVRLFKGLSVNGHVSYSRVRDQLAVQAGEATRDEILLRQRLLRTNYFYFINLGLSYRFGSIFNPVVNPRLNRGIGGGEIMMF